MPINQLFKEKPPIELIEKLLNLLGLNNINDTRKFSKKDSQIFIKEVPIL